jgi:2-polyprenyl-3-methyl-5-hydroxy-6-metoxy-1,4-benzoquinol methylase
VQLLVCPRDHRILEERDGHPDLPERSPLADRRRNPHSPALGNSADPPGRHSFLQAGASAKSSPTRLRARRREKSIRSSRTSFAATNGMLYIRLIGKLTDYPIPYLRLPPGEGKRFLEIGCNWGRWCIAAARMGYRPVGIDPSLKGIRAARQVALHLGIQAHYVAADAGVVLQCAAASF